MRLEDSCARVTRYLAKASYESGINPRMQQHYLDNAVGRANRIVWQNPGSIDAQILLGTTLLLSKRPDDAEKIFQSITKSNKDHYSTDQKIAKAHYWLGVCNEVLGDDSSAEHHYGLAWHHGIVHVTDPKADAWKAYVERLGAPLTPIGLKGNINAMRLMRPRVKKEMEEAFEYARNVVRLRQGKLLTS
jgi:tetratricopeptide (TPR) repeat protein